MLGMNIKGQFQIYFEDFECTSYEDWEGGFTLKNVVSTKNMKIVFEAALKRFNKNPKDCDVSRLLDFEVTEKFYNTLKIGTKDAFQKYKEWVAEDGIKLLSMEINKAIYRKIGNTWDLTIYLKGVYEDCR